MEESHTSDEAQTETEQTRLADRFPGELDADEGELISVDGDAWKGRERTGAALKGAEYVETLDGGTIVAECTYDGTREVDARDVATTDLEQGEEIRFTYDSKYSSAERTEKIGTVAHVRQQRTGFVVVAELDDGSVYELRETGGVRSRKSGSTVGTDAIVERVEEKLVVPADLEKTSGIDGVVGDHAAKSKAAGFEDLADELFAIQKRAISAAQLIMQPEADDPRLAFSGRELELLQEAALYAIESTPEHLSDTDLRAAEWLFERIVGETYDEHVAQIADDDPEIVTDGGEDVAEWEESVALLESALDSSYNFKRADVHTSRHGLEGYHVHFGGRYLFDRTVDELRELGFEIDSVALTTHVDTADFKVQVTRTRPISAGDRELIDGDHYLLPDEYGIGDDRDDGDEWDPEPAQLRDGETTDDSAHARRNAEAVRRAREELGRDVDDSDDDLETDGGADVYGCSYCGTRTVGETDVCPDCGGDTAPVGDPDVETDGGVLEDETELHVPDDDCVLITDGGTCSECGARLPDEIEPDTGVYCPECGHGQMVPDGGPEPFLEKGQQVIVEQHGPGGGKRAGRVDEIREPFNEHPTYVVDLLGAGQAHVTRDAVTLVDDVPVGSDTDRVITDRDDLEEAVDTLKGKLESDVSQWGRDGTGYDVNDFAELIAGLEAALDR